MANIKSFWIIVILFLSTRFILVKPSVEACNRTENGFICDEDATQCISAHHLCNGIPECPNGRDEAVSQCGCLPNEFRCSNSCVALVKRCDRNVDCEMGEDEEDCKTFICPKTHFKCNNHFCVPLHAVCDFKDDCGDQSDELNCLRRPCWNPEFRCDNGECLRPGQLCDGTIDCADGSDEKYCNVEDFVECGDGSYMNKYYWCDDWPNCPLNHADEINCGNCSLEEFQCPNGRCIRQANVCDSQCDCALTNKSANNEICADEINCHLYYSMQNGITVCEPGESLGCSVPTGSVRERCIKFKYLCDGYNDCHNGNFLSDEFGCGGRNEFPESTFVCQDNRTLPSSLKCDFKADCLHGDDEFNCTENNCTKHEFQCNNGQCVQYNARCDLKLDCLDKSDELDCDEFTCKFGFRKCINSGQCVRADYWCDYFVDCPDGSDERNCNFTTSDCNEGQFRCNSGQCISGNLQCFNSGEYRTGCADKSHLTHCKDWTCLEDQFKCSLGPCLNLSLLCNSQVDCSDYWEDEENCTFACSNTTPQCDCKDVHINCTGRGVIQVPQDVEKEITWFYFGSNNLNGSLTNETFLRLDRLLYLDLSNNSISTLPALLFVNLWRLSVLDLHDNKLTLLANGSFIGLGSLKVLHLQGNKLHALQSHAFYGLLSLKTLDLHGQKLHAIEPGAFVGLRSLNGLDLSSNEITYLDHGSLLGMPQLLFLYLRNNKIEVIEENVFRSTASLYRLETDEFRFCCLARHTTFCLPHPDEFSSCEDLLSNLVLRLCVWLLAGVATVGNILVIIWRSRYSHCNQVHSFLITNLALGDLLMGSYLLVIALVDCHYRGVYFIHDSAWRSSSLCAIAGFLSTFSSELSVFTLTVITLDRFLVIIFPFRVRRMEMARTRRLMVLGWVIAAIVSAVPLLNIQYFQNFYGRSGVCLALHITPDQPNGWEYSVIIFLFLNLVSFSIIAASYLWMFFAARTTQLAVKKDRRSTESAMAWRMSLLVATDAACWVPIITLGLASLAGFTVPPQVFAWVAVFVLPLNAALNPVLYTLSTAPFLNPARHSLLTFRQSWKLSRYNSSISGTTTHRYGRSRSNLSTCYSITNRSSIRWQQRVETASEVRESIPISSITT